MIVSYKLRDSTLRKVVCLCVREITSLIPVPSLQLVTCRDATTIVSRCRKVESRLKLTITCIGAEAFLHLLSR